MTTSLYEGRKFLGPLDMAVINAQKSRENLLKTILLTDIVEELVSVEAQLKKDDLTKTELLMLQLMKKQIEVQLNDFLGVPYDDGTPENC